MTGPGVCAASLLRSRRNKRYTVPAPKLLTVPDFAVPRVGDCSLRTFEDLLFANEQRLTELLGCRDQRFFSNKIVVM
jgi:hypothetical protein